MFTKQLLPIRLFLLLSLVCVSGACIPTQLPIGTPKPATAIATITYVEGIVKIISVSQGQSRVAKAYASVYPGDRLELAEQARATIICFDEHFLTLSGPINEVITSERCASSTPLPDNTARLVKPDAGRIQVYKDSLALEEQAREHEADYGNLPLILSPRHTSLLDLSPPVQWTAVEDAIEYQLSLSGLDSFDDIVLDARDANCEQVAGAAGNRVCSMPWPTTWHLASGQRYFFTVSARTGIATPLRVSESSSLYTLDAIVTAQVQAETTAIETLASDPITQDLLRAGFYADHELYALAIPLYEQVLVTQPTPVLYTTLGDLYRAIDLQRYAFNAYQQALEQLAKGEDDPAVHATAEFGLGQVEYSRSNYPQAASHYVVAVKYYTNIGAWEELQATEHALEAIQMRIRG